MNDIQQNQLVYLITHKDFVTMQHTCALYCVHLEWKFLQDYTHTRSVQHYTISRRYTLKSKNTRENLQSCR